MPLSTRQCEYLALAWQCFETEPKIDLEKFAQVAGLASANSARELMRVTKKKLKEEYGALSGSVSSANGGSGPKTPSKKKTTATGTPASTTGTGKKRGRKGTLTATNGDGAGEDRDDEEVVGMNEEKKAKKAKVNGGGSEGIKTEEADEEDWVGEFGDFLG